mmetsp:Transcript_8468/g.25446  ORF Transcript_8468/g.25446 Transcript_8468/m.25446 type:complete len:214 (+) Transcript_8468:93-734(+)|eukprot:CAMPEP_0198722922 /NCGR_PEP_ID=MMETSP1475-20131203/496_1 /TAXON_ID= ORGANISM="Unidentified sp., Strain CCMP1999" /NCGR_SAMPLE_ID=MMETSP1475 /ASSEMBLY_ACC=CAM_ASM_001111 /LENGTH=213 /DNA_ID=CAMNT_0044483877 /DNA_START=39 /DNA_END=680 /DNA_ORIENTATION=+
MAFVSGVSVSSSSKTAFSGCRVNAKVAPTTARWTMAKSKVAPMFDVPKNLDGSMPGDLGFDPFGFSNFISLTWLREAELKHSRICMLAALGFLVQEFYKFPFYSPAPQLPVPAHDYFVKFGSLGQILFFTSAFETVIGFPAILQSMQGSPRKPGDFKFDPLGLGKTEQAFKRWSEVELTNGRLAMIAIGGFVHQYWITKMGVVEQLTHGKLFP